MCAARMMLDAGVGVLRTLPVPDTGSREAFRRAVHELGFTWPEGVSIAELLAGLPADDHAALAVRRAATTLLRGAGYAAFDRPAGLPLPGDHGHGGIGAPYAHVTAPLRRLVDRFGTELCLAVAAGEDLPDWLRAALPALPEIMAASDSTAGKVDRACVDRTEAALLAGRVGEEFDGVVLRPGGPEGEPGEVYVPDPPVLARCTGSLKPGSVVRVRLQATDATTGRMEFTAV
jgi:exoribonuclease R